MTETDPTALDQVLDQVTDADWPTWMFDPADSPFHAAMARGHQMRTGHALAGYYYAPTGEPGIVKLERTCCEGGGE